MPAFCSRPVFSDSLPDEAQGKIIYLTAGIGQQGAPEQEFQSLVYISDMCGFSDFGPWTGNPIPPFSQQLDGIIRFCLDTKLWRINNQGRIVRTKRAERPGTDRTLRHLRHTVVTGHRTYLLHGKKLKRTAPGYGWKYASLIARMIWFAKEGYWGLRHVAKMKEYGSYLHAQWHRAIHTIHTLTVTRGLVLPRPLPLAVRLLYPHAHPGDPRCWARQRRQWLQNRDVEMLKLLGHRKPCTVDSLRVHWPSAGTTEHLGGSL